MILVTVGTEQFPFNALMDWIDTLIRYQFIDRNEEVIVQYGASTRLPDHVRIYQRLPESDFTRLVKEARVVIAHCGEGTSLLLESLGKPYVLVPRAGQFGEHVDDHQLEMADAMEKQGVAIARSPADLVRFLAEPKAALLAPQSNSKLSQFLSSCYPPDQYRKLMLVCSSGGHFKAMQELSNFWEPFSELAWVTFRTAATEAELKPYADHLHWAYSPTNRNIPNLIRNLILAFKVLRDERPDLVVSTGAGVAVPFLLIARFVYGSKVVFVESKTRLQELSLSARLLRLFSALDQLIVQGQELTNRYPEAVWVDSLTATGSASISKPQSTVSRFQNSVLLSAPDYLGMQEADTFVQRVQTLCEEKPQTIVVDMSATRLIDGAGLGALFGALKLAQASHSELVLWSVNPTVMSVLSQSRFDRLLKIEAATGAIRSPKSTQSTGLFKTQTAQRVQHPVRRAADIAISLVGLVVLALLMGPIALAIKLEDRGPIFSSQMRCGFLGRPFRVWKFRTTAVSSDPAEASYCESDCYCNLDTQPLTLVGQFLRWTGLDRLPLCLNVLAGDMRLFGRRAPNANEVDIYSPSQWGALNVKPGVLGEWQTAASVGMQEFEDRITLNPDSTKLS